MESKRTLRGMAVLTVAGAVLAAALLSPVSAAFNPTKAKVKNIAKKQANKVVDAENAIVYKDIGDGDVGGTSGFDLDASTSLGSITLPAGTWLVHSDFNVSRNSGGLVVICTLRVGGTELDRTNTFESDAQSVETMSLQGAATLASGGTAEVRCDDGVQGGGGDANYQGLDIVGVEGSSLIPG